MWLIPLHMKIFRRVSLFHRDLATVVYYHSKMAEFTFKIVFDVRFVCVSVLMWKSKETGESLSSFYNVGPED